MRNVILRPAIMKAGLVYFALVFACGWVLGPIREVVLVPWLGRTAGVAIEAPLMVAAMIVAARWTLRRLAIPGRPAPRIAAGLIALGLLLAAELAGTLGLRGLSVEDYLAGLGTVAGGFTIALFLLFAAMPALAGDPRPPSTGERE